MTDVSYHLLLQLGAPRLQPGLQYRITLAKDGDLIVRVVRPRRWWFDRELGFATSDLWHMRRSQPGASQHVADLCTRAYADWQRRCEKREVERLLLGRHPS